MNVLRGNTLDQSHGAPRVPWLTIGLSIGMILLFQLKDQFFQTLYFSQEATMKGEVWRILTGHFIHCSLEHLFWDLLAFLILGSVLEYHCRKDFYYSLALSCLGVSGWLLCASNHVPSYCGLSGALNGMLVVAAMTLFRQTGNKRFVLVIFATMGKIIFEFFTHQTMFTNLSLQSVPSAHAAGLFMGVLYETGKYIKNVVCIHRTKMVKTYSSIQH